MELESQFHFSRHETAIAAGERTDNFFSVPRRGSKRPFARAAAAAAARAAAAAHPQGSETRAT